MRKKRYSISSITPWENEKQTETGWIVWYRYGGGIRGELSYWIVETEEEARQFAADLLSYNA